MAREWLNWVTIESIKEHGLRNVNQSKELERKWGKVGKEFVTGINFLVAWNAKSFLDMIIGMHFAI